MAILITAVQISEQKGFYTSVLSLFQTRFCTLTIQVSQKKAAVPIKPTPNAIAPIHIVQA
jgi:hypothetical protein